MSFHLQEPTLETTCAHQRGVSIFVGFFSTRMSSCICWKTRSDAQTTTHGHLDRTCENTVRPMKHQGSLRMPGTERPRSRLRIGYAASLTQSEEKHPSSPPKTVSMLTISL